MIILFQLSEVHDAVVTALFDKYSYSKAETAHCTWLTCLEINVCPSLIRDYSVLEIYDLCILMILPSRATASAENTIKLPKLRPRLSQLVSADIALFKMCLFLHKKYFKSVASPLHRRHSTREKTMDFNRIKLMMWPLSFVLGIFLECYQKMCFKPADIGQFCLYKLFIYFEQII